MRRNSSQGHDVLYDNIHFEDMVNDLNDREGYGNDKSNYDMFKKDFPDKLAMLYPDAKDEDEISVVIVGHSSYMRDYLTCDLRSEDELLDVIEKKFKSAMEKNFKSVIEKRFKKFNKKTRGDWPTPRNNEVWLQEYITELPSQETLSSPNPQKRTKTMMEGACRPLFENRDKFPEEPALTCEQDIGRCSESRRPFELLKRDKTACGGKDICAAALL